MLRVLCLNIPQGIYLQPAYRTSLANFVGDSSLLVGHVFAHCSIYTCSAFITPYGAKNSSRCKLREPNEWRDIRCHIRPLLLGKVKRHKCMYSWRLNLIVNHVASTAAALAHQQLTKDQPQTHYASQTTFLYAPSTPQAHPRFWNTFSMASTMVLSLLKNCRSDT